ncbi:MAG: hypothetical protein P4L59_08275 [Desulfosporosinus sp.]|nr:hypothetical protein [Desulfosporosinus sp.]
MQREPLSGSSVREQSTKREDAPRDLSMDGLMPRCQGWQGAAHMQNIPEVWCVSFDDKRAAPELW